MVHNSILSIIVVGYYKIQKLLHIKESNQNDDYNPYISEIIIIVKNNYFFQFFYQICRIIILNMKERKKIKYVEKQPPDKQEEQHTEHNLTTEHHSHTHHHHQAHPQAHQQRHQQAPSTYLFSHETITTQEQSYQPRRNVKKEQYKPKYIPKEEQINRNPQADIKGHQEKQQKGKKYHRPNYKENEYDYAAPQTVSKQTSGHSHQEESCIICSQEMRRKDFVWTCICCSISMHLKCIKNWIFNVNKDDKKKHAIIFNWKCPQCNYQYNETMPKYYCFCGKHLNPEYDRDLQPHSCGQICSKKRGAYCPHPCPERCHKGKCKPCNFEGASVNCQCGKSQRIVKCSEERQVFQCGKKCQKILTCHKHKCQRNCHPGQCLACKKKQMVDCFCGKNSDIVSCGETAYSCPEICNKLLNCGFHRCEERCHGGQCNSCIKTPQLQKTCPCGKYDIQMLTGDPQYRKECSEPIPVCGMPCSRKLDCGHICPRSCHQGPCPPCKVNVDQTCTCLMQTRKIECWKLKKQDFKCVAVCKKKRSCGQHICNQVCCKFRTSPISQNHTCELNCIKLLNCGKHQCGEQCHMGLCKKCPVIYSQPQPCPCGKTSLKPPILCGTLVPECNNVCDKQLPCGHKCKNICHYGPCRCVQDVTVACRCQKQQIKTICGREALCLSKCKNILACGHKCDLQCHRDTCQVAHKSAPCRKICNRERKDCHHLCPQLCHQSQQCQSFSCEAQVLVKCDCGLRNAMVICGAYGNPKSKKAIVCNKKCENFKRFDILYKDKEIYYPGNMVQFAFKNYNYLLNLEQRLEKFILHLDEHFIQIQYKFTDNNVKVLLSNLFESHYHLNTHFYRYRKYASFTLMQTENTMIPKPVLTQYIKLIAKGTLKQSNLPFQFTISFECQQRQKMELILNNLKGFLHKYYSQKNSKTVSLHFWSKQDGLQALKFLQQEYQTIQFKCGFNVTKLQEQVNENEIIEEQGTEEESQNNQAPKKFQKLQIKVQSKHQVIPSLDQTQLLQPTTQAKEPQPENTQKFSSLIEKVLEPKEQIAPKIIIRKGIPNFKKNDYPDSKENIQDIYLLDEDQLYKQSIDWKKLMEDLCKKRMGPEATQWRIRSLLIASSIVNIEDQVFHQQFSHLISLYEKDKEKTVRILEIQRIQNKSVKSEMRENGIYLSDHEPEMLAYLQFYNYLSVQKIMLDFPEIIMNTPEVQKALEIIRAIEKKDPQAFFSHFNSSDYIFSCAMIPLIHIIRQTVLEEIQKGAKIIATNLHKYLLFNSSEQFIEFALENGLVLQKKMSKSLKEQVYGLKEGKKIVQYQKNSKFIDEKIYKKRDKSYFLVQPQELVNDTYMTRSFFVFGDFKESISPKYMLSLVKLLKQKPE